MNESEQWFRPTGNANLATITAYIDRLFRCWDWSQGGLIALRGIGEKGTPKEGVFRENKLISPASPFYLSQIETHASRWGQNSIASFLLPGIVSSRAGIDGDVKEDKIEAFTALCVDIDSGNVEEKLDHCREWIGEPSFVVLSGGQTELAHDKVHAYWCLNAPTDAIAEVGRLRKLLAAKVGGDRSFGRPAQVIRLPGSIYGKGGVHKPVNIALDSGLSYDFHDLADGIEGMEWMEGCEPPELAQVALPSMDQAGGMDFSGGAGKDLNRLEGALTTPVSAGGDGEETRWSRFNQVAGHYIHCVREGKMGIEEARELVHGWMVANMNPPWPEPRFAQEWTGLLNKDLQNYGAIVPPPPPGDGIRVTENIERIESTDDLLSWEVSKRTSAKPAERRVLVDGLIYAAKRHMFVAEGGAGKTFLMMDLVLKLAAATPDGPPLYWMGQRVMPEAYGKTYILMTGEDDIEELDIRWNAIDPSGELRRAAGDRLIALPMDNLGGAFPLVAYHPHTREPVASEKWSKLYGALKGVEERGGSVGLIAIDTLNSTLHGEENSAAIISEYIRAIAPICGDLKAALLVSHHIRKVGDVPIRDLDDMRNAIRGSTALVNGMRVVIGLYHAPDWQKQMKLLGLPPARGKLYQAGVVKTNVPSFEGVKYLLRNEKGFLMDVTGQAKEVVKQTNAEIAAWLEYAIGVYADEGYFFTVSSRDDGYGLYAKREKLPPIVEQMGRDAIQDMAKAMLAEGRLVKRTVDRHGTAEQWLDLKTNEDTPRTKRDMSLAVPEPDWSKAYYDAHERRVKPFPDTIHGGER